MVTAYAAGEARFARGQRAHATEARNNVLTTDLDRREHGAHRLEHVVDFALVADGVLGIFDPDVGGPHQNFAMQRKENADAAVFVFVEELLTGRGREEFRMIDDEV